MKITVTRDDGTTVDITEEVRAAHEAAYESTQCYECDGPSPETVPALDRIAVACGFLTSAERKAEAGRAHREWQAQREREKAEENRAMLDQIEANMHPTTRAMRDMLKQRGLIP